MPLAHLSFATTASPPPASFPPTGAAPAVSQDLYLQESLFRTQGPRTFGVNHLATTVLLLGIASIAFFIWAFHKCRPKSLSGGTHSNRQLAAPSPDEEASDSAPSLSGLDVLAEVCSSLPSLPLPPPAVSSDAGGRTEGSSAGTSSQTLPLKRGGDDGEESSVPGPSKRHRGEEAHGNEEEKTEQRRSAGAPDSLEFLLTEASLANVPLVSGQIDLSHSPWSIPSSLIMANGHTCTARKIATELVRFLSKGELSPAEASQLLERAKDLLLYLRSITIRNERAMRPCVVADRVRLTLFCVDSLYRVTELFPTATNPAAWWDEMLRKLDLNFIYLVPHSRKSTIAYIEECRSALLMYTERKRPSPALLQRLLVGIADDKKRSSKS